MYFLEKVQCLVGGDGHGLVKMISVHCFCGNGDDAFFLKYLLLAISIRHSCPDIRVLARKFVDISVLSCFKPHRQLYTYHRSLSQSLGHREWPFWPWPWQLTINRPLDQWSSNTSKNTFKKFDVRAVSNSFTMFLKHDIILFHFKQAMETKIFLPFPMYMTLWVLAHGHYYLGNMSATQRSVDSRNILGEIMTHFRPVEACCLSRQCHQ